MTIVDTFLTNAMAASDMLTVYADMVLDNLESLSDKDQQKLLSKIATTQPADANEAGALAIIQYLIGS